MCRTDDGFVHSLPEDAVLVFHLEMVTKDVAAAV